jgi:hypothetical protein
MKELRARQKPKKRQLVKHADWDKTRSKIINFFCLGKKFVSRSCGKRGNRRYKKRFPSLTRTPKPASLTELKLTHVCGGKTLASSDRYQRM